jgi:hypothetical protein
LEREIAMMSHTISPEGTQLFNLLKEYSFDVDPYTTHAVVEGWLQTFDFIWISHAITEALYQGRYKLVSVEQILRLWQRRGHPIRHFNREFETLILGQSFLCYPDSNHAEAAQTLLPNQHGPDPDTEAASSLGQTSLEPGPEGGVTDPHLPYDRSTPLGQTSYAPIPVQSQGQDDASESEDLTTWFQSTMPVPNFRAVNTERAKELYCPEPIRPFVPRQETSPLHQRLKSVVQASPRSTISIGSSTKSDG